MREFRSGETMRHEGHHEAVQSVMSDVREEVEERM
jgi:hypothetical protein